MMSVIEKMECKEGFDDLKRFESSRGCGRVVSERSPGVAISFVLCRARARTLGSRSLITYHHFSLLFP